MPRNEMLIAHYERYGPPEVLRLERRPAPMPGPGQVLVRVHASTVCAADWRFRRPNPSFLRLLNGLTAPKRVRTLGMEFAGVVEELGEGTAGPAVGTRVFGSSGFGFGANTTHLVLPATATLAPLPEGLSFAEAAAVPFGGLTAVHFLRQCPKLRGARLLLYGGSGAVGVYALQLARRQGAHVTAVAGPAHQEALRALGADEVLDYTREDFAASGRRYGVVFDTVGYSGFRRTLRVLEPGGTYLRAAAGQDVTVTGMVGEALTTAYFNATARVRIRGGVTRATAADLAELGRLLGSGELRAVIGRSFALTEIVEAHRYAESGHKLGAAVLLHGEPAQVQ